MKQGAGVPPAHKSCGSQKQAAVLCKAPRRRQQGSERETAIGTGRAGRVVRLVRAAGRVGRAGCRYSSHDRGQVGIRVGARQWGGDKADTLLSVTKDWTRQDV